jgi:hypothetical protein
MIVFVIFVFIAIAYSIYGTTKPAKKNQDAGIVKRFLWTIPGVFVIFIVFLIVGSGIAISTENWFMKG